jgi:endonuclease/exonuclease/phosphatase family metal-dependent hydrolase
MLGVTVASFNVHGGVDGFGRPFDLVEACRQLDADVLVLQEAWSPASGPSQARVIADALGYEVQELALTVARVCAPAAGAPGPAVANWGPVLRQRGPYGLRVGAIRPGRSARVRSTAPVEEGSWGIALLCRVPVLAVGTLDLGQLPRDPARRGALTVDIEVDGTRLRVVGTHMSHLSHGSVLQLRTLHRLITVPGQATVLAGDMNMWGPPLSALFPGWRRAVRGRTWPAWRPVAQLDHILISREVETLRPGEVSRVPGSDHRPVRARLTPRVGAPVKGRPRVA